MEHHSGASRWYRGLVLTLTASVLSAAFTAVVPPESAGAAEGDFVIFDGTATSPILVDPSYGDEHDDRDYRQVRRAVQDLRQDVAMV